MNRVVVVARLSSLPHWALAGALLLAPVASLASPPHGLAPASPSADLVAPRPVPVPRPQLPPSLHVPEPGADPPAEPAAQPVAPAPLPAGVATSPTEAPTAPRLAPLPAEPSPASPVVVPDDPAHERSMSFTSVGGPVCRETVPGGSLLAAAYAVVLLVLGAYVGLLARKNGQLATQLTDLEDEIARRRDARPADPV